MFKKIPQMVAKAEVVSHIGKIENVVGMSIEASGGRSGIGDIVMIYNEEQNRQVPAEVVGFKDGKTHQWDNLRKLCAQHKAQA